VARMDISLPNAHIRGKRKTMRRKRSLTKAILKIINSQRRSHIVKLILIKNRTQSDESFESENDDVTTIAIKGKASSSKSLFPNLLSTHASWQRKAKRR
jgi:hypothetical protein